MTKQAIEHFWRLVSFRTSAKEFLGDVIFLLYKKKLQKKNKTKFLRRPVV